jgi:hypothetical protein
MDQTPTSPPRKRRNPPTPELWAQIRQDWCANCSSRELERHYDVGRDAINARARVEGWTRPTPPPLAPEPPQTIAKVATLDELLDSLLGEILNAYNDKRHPEARDLAKSAEVYARLKTRWRRLRRLAGARTTTSAPVFVPERCVFDLLDELGLKPEDVL